MKIARCRSTLREHLQEGSDPGHAFERNPAESADLGEETAVNEAEHCLGVIRCESCDLCRLLCPDLCVTRDEKTGKIEIDYDFCKGCGICAAACPRGAIRMVSEEIAYRQSCEAAAEILSDGKGVQLAPELL